MSFFQTVPLSTVLGKKEGERERSNKREKILSHLHVGISEESE